jgi:hypothetical protein
MKAIIRTIKQGRQWHSDKYNKDYFDFNVGYETDGIFKDGIFTTTKKEQTAFEIDKEYDITEEQREYQGNVYFKIKPVRDANFGGSNYSRKLKQEQARYSGFAMAYAKDLVVAEKIEFEQMLPAAKKMFDFMVKLDKEIQQ